MKTLPIILLAGALISPATAQTMYKCPNAAGVLQYQQLPCEGGEVTQIKTIRASGVSEEETSEKTGQINQLTKQMGRDRRLCEIKK